MNDNFFVGLDELYHHAKFVEDRTSCAGYNWENMVCFLLAGFAKRQDAGIRFLHRPKINFFAHRGVQRFTSNLAWPTPTGTWVLLAEQNFSSIGIWEWECGHRNIKSYHFLVLPSLISIIFTGLYTDDYASIAFQISCGSHHRLRSYCWKPRVGQLGRIFPRILYRENYASDQKWMTSFLTASTSSITMQSLGKIVLCAPAVGAKMLCLFFFLPAGCIKNFHFHWFRKFLETFIRLTPNF